MISNFLIKYSPPGMELSYEKRIFYWGMLLSAFYSFFGFFANFSIAFNKLYNYIDGKRVLNINETMQSFHSLLGRSFIGFYILATVMIGSIIYRYAYYRQGSKNIYTMKRLPQKYEWHKRALVIPIVSILICIIEILILIMIYFLIYIIVTPKACLLPNQWQMLWRLS